MRILHIMASRGLGGAETYALDMILSLHRAGIDQCVVIAPTAPRYTELQKAGVRLEPDILRWPIRLLQRWRLKKLAEREQPDLIHAWLRRAASLLPKMQNREIPIIGWFGGYYDPKHFGRCTHFVGVTKAIVEHMVEKNVPAERAFFVPTFPNIVDLPAIERSLLNTPNDAPVLLALSRLHPKKGLDTLLMALVQIPEAYLWLAGDGPLRDRLVYFAEALGVSSRVRFLGWRDDRSALLRAANICVLPSRYEPFGTVILEAWATGVPLVAARSAGPVAHISDEQNGMLVPIDDDEALAAALQRVLKDDALRRRLVAEGYIAYRKDYTREVVTEKMLSLYQKLTSE